MHKMCKECGIHFIGDNKDMIIECKALRHEVMEVADTWDKGGQPIADITMKMNEFSPDMNNKSGVFKSRIIARGELETYDKQVVYFCRVCNDSLTYKADESRNVPDAPTCKDCRVKMKRDEGSCTVDFIRSLIIQEPYDETKNMTPMALEATITGMACQSVFIGQDKKLSGIFRSVKKRNSENNRIIFDVKRIEDLTDNKDIMPTDEEILKFKEMMKDGWVDKLAHSFAPEIYGLENEKLSLILSLVSGEKIGDLRGDINTLLVGDPSTAKSRLLKYVLKVTPKSAYALGRSSSSAGLVMGVDKLADGRNVVKAGPVVLCHKGCVCIDEIDKMKSDDRSALHEVMEQQTATLNKIGSNLTMPAETVIIAAANPKASKYDISMGIVDNINMPDSLLSRFDLIFLVRDISNRDLDLAKIRHISKVRQNQLGDEILSLEQMQKLINYAKKQSPKLLPESVAMLEQFFVKLRGYEQSEDSLSIDMRGFEGLIRLATANAKLRFCDTIEEQDINEAIRLYKYSLESFGMKTSEDRQAGLVPEHLNKEQFVIKTIRENSDEEGLFDADVVVDELVKDVKKFKTDKSASDYIENMHTNGLLLYNNGRYKYVSRR